MTGTPFAACLLYAVRVCVPPKRWALLALPVVASGLFGLLSRQVGDPTAGERLSVIAASALFPLVLPFVCLVVGDAVLAAEVRSGALALTWLSPTGFPTIVLARWLAGWAIAAVALAPAMALASVAAGAGGDAAVALAGAAVAGAGGYVALFVAVGVLVRRSTLWSLAIVLLGERLLGAALSGVAQLSPQWLATTAYGGLGPDADELLRNGVPGGAGAVVRLAVVAAVGLAVASQRLGHLRLAGSTD